MQSIRRPIRQVRPGRRARQRGEPIQDLFLDPQCTTLEHACAIPHFLNLVIRCQFGPLRIPSPFVPFRSGASHFTWQFAAGVSQLVLCLEVLDRVDIAIPSVSLRGAGVSARARHLMTSEAPTWSRRKGDRRGEAVVRGVVH